jgi:hypothetical protein
LSFDTNEGIDKNVGGVAIDHMRKIYESIVTSWTETKRQYYMDFDRVKKWFEEDKINIMSSGFDSSKNIIEFRILHTFKHFNMLFLAIGGRVIM